MAKPAPSPGEPSPAYQITLVALLSINFGVVFFDRNALGFLMPFVQPDLHLTNTEVGVLSSALSLTWAFAAFGIGVVSDKTGKRTLLLVVTTLLFSVCSFLSGIAASFAMLLAARLLMGVAEGGIMPISQAIVASKVRAQTRGIAMGVTQNFGSNLLGSFVAPVVLAAFAASYGWRHAFFLAGAPGLLIAMMLWKFLGAEADAEPSAGRRTGSSAPRESLRELIGNRNVVICALLGVLLVSYLVVCWSFMPLYLVKVRHYDPRTAGWLMGALGISATLGSFLISGLSDRLGRRPLMILMPLIGVVLPLGALYYQGSAWILALIFFVGWGLNGVFPLFMATIPSESVALEMRASALGLCMGTGEIVGGVAAPSVAGFIADRVGLQAPLWIMLALTIIAGLLAFGLRETAPNVVAARGAATQPAT